MSISSRKLRWRFQRRAVLLLALIWVVLWRDASLLNILYGLVLGWLVTVVFWLAPIRYYGRPRPGGSSCWSLLSCGTWRSPPCSWP